MLSHLSIQNYALIEKIEINFPKGLTIITGETGAYPELRFNANPSFSSNSLEQKLVNGTEIKRNNALSEVINANVQLNWNLFNGFKLYATKDRGQNSGMKN